MTLMCKCASKNKRFCCVTAMVLPLRSRARRTMSAKHSWEISNREERIFCSHMPVMYLEQEITAAKQQYIHLYSLLYRERSAPRSSAFRLHKRLSRSSATNQGKCIPCPCFYTLHGSRRRPAAAMVYCVKGVKLRVFLELWIGSFSRLVSNR